MVAATDVIEVLAPRRAAVTLGQAQARTMAGIIVAFRKSPRPTGSRMA